MKFKERRGNVFVFDGGYDSEELELRMSIITTGLYVYEVHGDVILIDRDLNIECAQMRYKDIQTAVNLMTILKDEGLV